MEDRKVLMNNTVKQMAGLEGERSWKRWTQVEGGREIGRGEQTKSRREEERVRGTREEGERVKGGEKGGDKAGEKGGEFFFKFEKN